MLTREELAQRLKEMRLKITPAGGIRGTIRS